MAVPKIIKKRRCPGKSPFRIHRKLAEGLQAAGVMDQLTMREFDRLCLPPIKPLQPKEIKQIPETSRVKLAVFAALLNTSVSTRAIA